MNQICFAPESAPESAPGSVAGSFRFGVFSDGASDNGERDGECAQG